MASLASMQLQQRSSGLVASCSRRTPAPLAPRGRQLSVQVFAKKGQRMPTGMPGAGAMSMMAPPPTPEVDPENAEFVIFVKAKNYMEGRVEVKDGRWVPLSVVKGGRAANFLVKACESEWGHKLYGKTLVRQIGMAVYKDRLKIEQGIKSSYPPFANVPSKNFRYGFKIRDKANPKDWIKTDGLTEFPPESESSVTAMDELKKFFSAESLSSLFAKS